MAAQFVVKGRLFLVPFIHPYRVLMHAPRWLPVLALSLAALPFTASAERVLNHIMVIYGENTARTQARSQSYLGQLAANHAEFVNYRGVTHPSMPNYLALTSGAPQVATNVGCTSLAVTNLTDLLETAGIDWRGYNQSMVTPCVDNGSYLSKHDFFVNYTSVRTDPTRLAKILPLDSKDQSSYAELLGPAAPELVMVSPNMCDGGHNCGVARFDGWLAGTNGDTFFQDMLTSPYYLDGAIFLTFDEDDNLSGNLIYCAAISAHAMPGLTDGRTLNHYNLLRTIENNFGLPTMTANDAAATESMLTVFNVGTAVPSERWLVQ